MTEQTALKKKIMPLYKEFFHLLHQNTTIESDIKGIDVEQIKVMNAEKVKELNQKKAELLNALVKNEQRMDHLKMSLSGLDSGTPFENLFSKLEECGRATGTYELDIDENNLEALQQLSNIITESGFAQPIVDTSRGIFDPCICSGCMGCTDCTGCKGCSDACKNGCCWTALYDNS